LRARGIRKLAGPVIKTAIVLAIPVVTILALNAAQDDNTAGWARIDRIVSAVQNKIAAVESASVASAADDEQSRTFAHQLGYFGKKLLKGFVPWLVFPMALGMYRLRRRLRTPEHAALLAISLIIVGLVATYLLLFGEINTRYFLPGTLIVLPYTAYGLIVLVNSVSRRLPRGWAGKQVIFAAVIVALLAGGALRGLSVNREPLQRQADLGNWIRLNYGGEAVVACWEDYTLATYYAHASQLVLLPHEEKEWVKYFRFTPPNVVLADAATVHGKSFGEYVEAHPELGYRIAEVERFSSPGGSQVFLRNVDGAVSR
jgi:hypothetical protein